MNVLSLFDGMSCGQIALERAGINVSKYYAAELDKYAIKVTQANYPNTIQLGDVTKWREWDIDWAGVDLLIGGSPCQGFSFAGKQLAFDDPRSKLFFVYVDILNHIRKHNPSVKFMLENVKMKKEYLDVISEQLGVQPVFINSALVSAQNRQRYYWTNIENIEQPKDKGILLKDILEDNISKLRPCELREFKTDSICHHAATAIDIKGNECIKRVYADSGKAPTLTTMGGGHREPKVLCGVMTKESAFYRKLTPLECERLQTVPDNYTAHVSNTQRYKMIGNGWTVDVIAHIFNSIECANEN